jgi:hypothetical protein
MQSWSWLVSMLLYCIVLKKVSLSHDFATLFSLCSIADWFDYSTLPANKEWVKRDDALLPGQECERPPCYDERRRKMLGKNQVSKLLLAFFLKLKKGNKKLCFKNIYLFYGCCDRKGHLLHLINIFCMN